MKRRPLIPLVLMMSGIPLRPESPATSVPVFAISEEDSSIKFYVKASVSLTGVFKKWAATLTCTSTDPETCVLNLTIQGDSVYTGSGMKDRKLKGKDFFNVKMDPLITFKSTKVVPTGPNTIDLVGDFTIRGVSKPETVHMTLSRDETSPGGYVKGQMAFDRREYGMTSGIPFIKIADRVEVDVDLKAKRVTGPALEFKQ